MPPSDILLERGFIPLPKNKNSFNSYKFVYKSPSYLPNLPRLTWSTAPDGQDYLTAETSIPRFLYGTNTILLKNDGEIHHAINGLSEVVSSISNIDFDAENAIVGRVDFCDDVYKLQDDIEELLKSLQKHYMPRMTRCTYDNNTVYFRNKSQQIVCYSKYAEIKQLILKKKATEQDLERAQNIFRLEVRFITSQSSKRLASRLHLPSRNAGDLLQKSVAKKVLQESIKKLGLDNPVEPLPSRLKVLRQKYGANTHYLRLAGFISLCDEHGIENIARLGILSKSAIRAYIKDIREAGIILSTEQNEKLKPISLNL